MDLAEARAFLHKNHRGVLATRRGSGRIQQSPVLVNVDGEGRAIISSRETAYKVRNLRRDPWAQACVFTDSFVGQWLFVEGSAQVLSLPEAMYYGPPGLDRLVSRARAGRSGIADH